MTDVKDVKDDVKDVKVEKGMLLLYEKVFPETTEIPTRYELLAVSAVRRGAKTDRVTLLSYSPMASMVATASFPDGAIRPPFKLFALSQKDLAFVWSKLTSDGDLPASS